MSRHGLSEQVEHLRKQVDALKTSLDHTVQSFEDITARTENLGQEARDIVGILGEGGESSVPWGLFLTLALGAGIVWLVSPETFHGLIDFFKAQSRALRSDGNVPS